MDRNAGPACSGTGGRHQPEYALAFRSAVFDGIMARRFGVATPNLRRLDSIVDSVFYFATLGAAWHLHSTEPRTQIPWIAALLAFEALRYGFDFLKFRREGAYHLWSPKLWGILSSPDRCCGASSWIWKVSRYRLHCPNGRTM